MSKEAKKNSSNRQKDNKTFELKVFPFGNTQPKPEKSKSRSAFEEVYRLPAVENTDRGNPFNKSEANNDLLKTAENLANGNLENQKLSNSSFLNRISDFTSSFIKKIILHSSGQVGMAVASAIALWSALYINGNYGGWIYLALGSLLTIRFIYHITRGPLPVLARYRIRKRFWWVISDEAQISVGFMAACFLMSWPIDFVTVASFVIANLIIQFFMLSYAHLVMKKLAERAYSQPDSSFARRAIILGTGTHAQRVADMVIESPDLDTKIIGFLDYEKEGLWRYRDVPLLGHPGSIEKIIANGQVDAIFVAVAPEDIPRSRSLFDISERMGISIFVMPNVYYPTVAKIRPTFVNGMPALVYRSAPESRAAMFLKSAMDKIGAAIGLLILAPVMIFSALAIKIESRGPVFFKQTRSGINGRKFYLLKFRTMCTDAEEKKELLQDKNEMSGPVFKIRKDPRITKVGRILRKYSIDELPQFINVLTGDMSLVGPRPPLPSEVSHYLPWQHRKLSVKPGVTCLWQVNGRNDIGFDDWMRLDLEYIDNWSIWLDTKILAKTIPTVLKGTGV